MESNSKFKESLLSKVLKQIEESSKTTFEYEQGDIVKALFENENTSPTSFKERVDSLTESDGGLFHKLRKRINTSTENKEIKD